MDLERSPLFSLLVVLLSCLGPASGVHYVKCCFIHSAYLTFLQESPTTVASCVEGCVLVDKLTAVGNITYKIDGDNVITEFKCFCFDLFPRCLTVPDNYCFSRFDEIQERSTGGVEMAYSLYYNCRQAFYGTTCERMCHCDGHCSPTDGRCLGRKCRPNSLRHALTDGQFVCSNRRCDDLQGECRRQCDRGMDMTFLDCRCTGYLRYDIERNECSAPQACEINRCRVCKVVEGVRVCDCSGERDKSEVVSFGFPHCIATLGPCRTTTCEETPEGVCYEDPYGSAVCECNDGSLPDEKGECYKPLVLPDKKQCHGYFNQGFYYKCLCHHGYVVTNLERCEMGRVDSEVMKTFCERMTNIGGFAFCVCRNRCDPKTVCGAESCPSPPMARECLECPRAFNELTVNGSFGGAVLVNRLGSQETFIVLGPSDLETGMQFSFGNVTHPPTYSNRRSFKQVAGDVGDLERSTNYFVATAMKGTQLYQSFPIYFKQLTPIVYNYTIEGGFIATLRHGFMTHRIEVTWNMPPGKVKLLWYCSRILTAMFRKYSNIYPCYQYGQQFFQQTEGPIDLEERKLDIVGNSSYVSYYVYVVPIYLEVKYPELVKRITIAQTMRTSDYTIRCIANCGPELDLQEDLWLDMVGTATTVDTTQLICTWYIPTFTFDVEPFEGPSLRLSARGVRRLVDGEMRFKAIVFHLSWRTSIVLYHNATKERLNRKNCSIAPPLGYGLITRFTVTCEPGFMIKILSSNCGIRRDINLLKFRGFTDTPITDMIFSTGDPHDYYSKCLYILDDQLAEDEDVIRFVVLKNLTYVSNFQFLDTLRMDAISTIVTVGNTIEFFNDNPATDDLDRDFRQKCRELVLGLLVRNWNKLEDQALELESIKLIYMLLSNPFETDPYFVIENLYLYELLDATRLWVTDDFELTTEEFFKSLVHTAETLSYILYSAYLRFNETSDAKSRKVLNYVLDNLAYLGNYYVTSLDIGESKRVSTSVFTLYIRRFFMARSIGWLEFQVDRGENRFTVKIPDDILGNKSMSEISMKLAVFPFNPLALTTGSLFTPTVSISLYGDNVYLPLHNMLNPIKISVPTMSSEWLTYKTIPADSRHVAYMSLPSTLFNNTLYKLKITVELTRRFEGINRVEGVLGIVLCEGGAQEIQKRIASKDYRACYEIFFQRIDFYRRALKTFNLTLPPMLMLQSKSGLVYYFVSNQDAKYFVTFSMMQLSCQYWYEPGERSSYGCAVSPTETTDDILVCLCYHLSYFTGTTDSEGESLTVAVSTTEADDALSTVGLVLISSVWLFFFVFGIWARKMDKKYEILAYPVDLADNYPNAEYVYLIDVETGLRPFSGCTGTVFLVLIGTLNKSLPHKLVCRRYKTLQTGHQNYFLIRTKDPLGKITQIRLWIVDEAESGKKTTWYLNLVAVFDLQFRDAYVFICDEWMGVNVKGMGNDMTFYAATSLMLNEFNNIFTMNFFKGFVENHVWFSIFTNPTMSRFTRFQRVATCMLNTLLYLMTTLLLQLVERPAARSGTIFYSIAKDVILTIVIGIMISPLFWFFEILFSESRKRKVTHNIISDWNRNIGVKKEVDESPGEYLVIRYLMAAINYLSRIFKGTGYENMIDDPESMMFANIDVKKIGVADFNPFSEVQASAGSESPQVKKGKKNVTANNPYPGQAGNLDTASNPVPAPAKGHAKGGPTLEDEYQGEDERVNLLMKVILDGKGGKLKKKLKKQASDNVEGHLPWWINIVAWILLLMISAVTSVISYFLMMKNLQSMTLLWYLRVFLTLQANIFVIDPICIVTGAFCRSLVSRQFITFPLIRLGTIKEESIHNLSNYYDYHKRRVYKIRKSPYYKIPVMIKKKVKVEKKILHSKLLLLNIILFLYLLVCTLITSLAIRDYGLSMAKDSIEKVLIGPKISQIRERDQYYHWLLDHLIPSLYDDKANLSVDTNLMFSRTLNFQHMPTVAAHAISYPCFTRIPDLDTWQNYYDDPEWHIYETVCMGYTAKIARATVNVMRDLGFFNFNYVAMGTTFYVYVPSIRCVVWVFLVASHPPGGGFNIKLDTIFMLPEEPLPLEKLRVIVSLTIFWPAFAYFLFRNMKKFFYLGAGLYFTNLWNILDLITTFIVLMICILYAFVVYSVNDVLGDFYLYTGELYISFYLSGIKGFFILIAFMSFIIIIRTMELFQLNHLQRIFQICITHTLKTTLVVLLKFFGPTAGLIFLKMVLLSRYKYQYADFGMGFSHLIFDFMSSRTVMNLGNNRFEVALILFSTVFYISVFKSIIIADLMTNYRMLRRYHPSNKELINLVLYMKSLLVAFMSWSYGKIQIYKVKLQQEVERLDMMRRRSSSSSRSQDDA